MSLVEESLAAAVAELGQEVPKVEQVQVVVAEEVAALEEGLVLFAVVAAGQAAYPESGNNIITQ